MRRNAIAAVWILGATAPLLLAAAFLIGCCALPFHGLMHKLMPLCEMAASVVRGDHAGHDHEATPPARQKDEPAKRIITSLPARGLAVDRITAVASSSFAASSATGFRSFIKLGALRCDQDVGLHVFVALFRI
jgi:hypothetical protein